MIKVRCPKCAVILAIKQMPASGKMNCVKCTTTFQVASAVIPAATAAAPRAQAPVSRSSGPSTSDEIDFRSIPVSTAPASAFFPSTGPRRVYDGPIALDPIPVPASENQEASQAHGAGTPEPKASTAKKSKQKTVIISLVAGLFLLVAGGGGAYWFLGGSGGPSGPGQVDLAAAAAAAAPSGYQAKSLMNCVVLMPKGSWGDGKRKAIPSAIESEVVMSDATTSVFVLAVMDGGSQPIDSEQMRKKAARSLGGDILGGQPVERNGFKGIKGVLDQSVFLPRTNVEIFHHDGRFAIIGHALGSAGGEGAPAMGSPEEAKEVEVFFNSFKIGPAPAGFFGN